MNTYTALLLISLGALAVLELRDVHDSQKGLRPQRRFLSHYHHGVFTDDQATVNSVMVQAKKKAFVKLCESPSASQQDMKNYLNNEMFSRSRIESGTHADSLPVETCKRVFLDLGAHQGESVAQFITAGLPRCEEKSIGTRWNMELGIPRPTLLPPLPRPPEDSLTQWSRERMQEFDPDGGPEDYCVYSVEANPVFTDRLKSLEHAIMRMSPRPVRRLHFVTETAITNQAQGPTTLYMDTTSKKGHDMVGSSIYSLHNDIQRSYEKDKSVLHTQVECMNLSSLLKATIGGQKEGHLMIKMDIEGAEYKALGQAVRSKALCEYVGRDKFKVDLFVEYHSGNRLGDESDSERYESEDIRQQMIDCGITLHEFEASQ